MSEVHKQVKEPATDTAAPTDIDPIVKSKLELAWGKIEKGLAQEAEGRKLWVDGTIELITILHDARERFPVDQEFGKWLTDNGLGEDRITRHQRTALLNMALHPDLAREVLEETNRVSWEQIWIHQIQPRLPGTRQPPDGEEAPDEKPEQAPATTRRPKTAKSAKQKAEEARENEWDTDNRQWERDFDRVANDAMRVAAFIERCKPDQFRRLVQTIEPSGARARQVSEKWAELADRLDGQLGEEPDAPKPKGRVKATPPHRASTPVQQPSP